MPPSTPLPELPPIVHVASGREWRGGQRQVHLLLRGLSEISGFDSRLVTGNDSLLADRCRGDGIRVQGVTWSMGLDPRVVGALLGQVTPQTIIHAHDQHAHLLADAAARLRGGRVLVTRRVEFPIRHPARWRRVTHAIALSRAIEERIRAAGVPADRITRIPPGVAAPTATPWPREVAPPVPGTLHVVCIAALTQEKGIDLLLDAAALLHPVLPHLTWTVLGEGKERLALEQRRHALALDSVVKLPGHVEHPEAVLSSASIAVQPSRSEGFGSSVLDALSQGVPVVASDTGGLPDSLEFGGGRLVAAGDPHALADAVRVLLADPVQRTQLGEQGRRAAQEFSVSRLVERTIDVYRSAVMTTDSR